MKLESQKHLSTMAYAKEIAELFNKVSPPALLISYITRICQTDVKEIILDVPLHGDLERRSLQFDFFWGCHNVSKNIHLSNLPDKYRITVRTGALTLPITNQSSFGISVPNDYFSGKNHVSLR